MKSPEVSIDNVSDTALWVAHYRAEENERPDALFRDPFAKKLSGERGKQIAHLMRKMGVYTRWAVISRTVMIDQFVLRLVSDGVDTIVNLGAGLDARPYRMNLPPSLKWIEVDYPHMMAFKNEVLKSEKPTCELSRVSLDLADVEKRREFLSKINSESKKILVLTEGVLPYLTIEQVISLASDLKAQPQIAYWICEYFDPAVYKYLQSSVRTKKMKNAPFLFYPPQWIGFFEERGWTSETIKYSSEVAEEMGRKPPMPWFAFLFMLFASKKTIEKFKKMAGFMVLERKSI